jgi:hypothetical protein
VAIRGVKPQSGRNRTPVLRLFDKRRQIPDYGITGSVATEGLRALCAIAA